MILKKLISRKQAIIKSTTAVLLLSVAQLGVAASPIWEVSKGSHKLWLGASLSALEKTAYPLPAEFDDAFRRADKLYVERDIQVISQPDFGVRAMQASVYDDGRNLKTVLKPALWQELDTYVRARGVPMFSLLMFKPAFAGFTLSVLEAKRLDLANGVDAYYFHRARNNKKPIVTLESIDQQLQFLQEVNEIDANILVSAMLEELNNLPQTLEVATKAWREGDMKKLDQVKGEKMRSKTPALYETLVTNRSEAWVAHFRTMLSNPDVEFVLVDAVHFTGADNLLQLLTAAGYTVKPYSL